MPLPAETERDQSKTAEPAEEAATDSAPTKRSLEDCAAGLLAARAAKAAKAKEVARPKTKTKAKAKGGAKAKGEATTKTKAQTMKRPAARRQPDGQREDARCAVPAERQAATREVEAEVPADAEPQYKNQIFDAEVYSRCKVEYYTAKSYIRQSTADGWKMVIGSSDRRHHRQICHGLLKSVKAGVSRVELNTLRAVITERLLNGNV